jgi:hypothetical protein
MKRKKNPYIEDEQMMKDALLLVKQNLSPSPIPFLTGHVSTLGGNHRPSMMLTASLDPKDTWINGILENSRYGKFHIDYNGTMEMHSGYGVAKFRKCKIKGTQDLISKLHTWAEKS